MKTVKIIISVCLVISILMLPLSVYSYIEEEDSLKDFVRLHIRANSDSEEDQALKLAVRDRVLSKTTELLADCESSCEAKRLLSENTDSLVCAAESLVREAGFDYAVTARLDREYFERRDYEGFFLPEGYYDALIIEIGSGEGHNWWCVLYPCVCLSGSTGEVRTDTEKVPDRYKTSSAVSDGDVKFDFWIFKFFRSLFS